MTHRLALVTPVDPNRAEYLGELAASISDAAGPCAAVGVQLVWSVCFDGSDPVPAVPEVTGVELCSRRLSGRWGPSVARNAALVGCAADWVLPVDADDVCVAAGLAEVLAELQAGAAWVASARVELDGAESPYVLTERTALPAGELNRTYRHPYLFHANNVAYRRSVLLDAGG